MLQTQILSAVNTVHVHLSIFPFLSDTSWEGLCHPIVLRQQSIWNVPLYLDAPLDYVNCKTCVNGHSKTDKTKILMTNGSLMKFKSIAECSPWSILQCFWPSLSVNWSWKPICGLFESDRFTQVFLYYTLYDIYHIFGTVFAAITQGLHTVNVLNTLKLQAPKIAKNNF